MSVPADRLDESHHSVIPFCEQDRCLRQVLGTEWRGTVSMRWGRLTQTPAPVHTPVDRGLR